MDIAAIAFGQPAAQNAAGLTPVEAGFAVELLVAHAPPTDWPPGPEPPPIPAIAVEEAANLEPNAPSQKPDFPPLEKKSESRSYDLLTLVSQFIPTAFEAPSWAATPAKFPNFGTAQQVGDSSAYSTPPVSLDRLTHSAIAEESEIQILESSPLFKVAGQGDNKPEGAKLRSISAPDVLHKQKTSNASPVASQAPIATLESPFQDQRPLQGLIEHRRTAPEPGLLAQPRIPTEVSQDVVGLSIREPRIDDPTVPTPEVEVSRWVEDLEPQVAAVLESKPGNATVFGSPEATAGAQATADKPLATTVPQEGEEGQATGVDTLEGSVEPFGLEGNSEDLSRDFNRHDSKNSMPAVGVGAEAGRVQVREPGATEKVIGPAKRQDVIRQISDRIEMLAAARPREGVVVHLQPHDLGTVTLVIKRLSNVVEAEILASDERVRDALVQSRPQLALNLEQRGLNLNKIEILAHTNLEHQGQSADRHQHQETQQHAHQARNFTGSFSTVQVATTRSKALSASGMDLWI